MTPSIPTPDGRASLLRADCGSCAGLCCVALAFARSADFAFDKDAGDPCDHLDDGFRCDIHSALRDRGMKGCTVFDCFGAGQQVTQRTFAGRSWRQEPASSASMFAVFPVVRQLHELLWYLAEARAMPAAAPLHADLEGAWDGTRALTDAPAAELVALDVAAHRAVVSGLLTGASDLARSAARAGLPALPKRLRPGADLLGARLAGQDLRGACLRGAYLIAADLRGCDLGLVDLLGADLRDADVSGADLSRALYLTQFQVNAAHGDASTRLPPVVSRPSHWAP